MMSIEMRGIRELDWRLRMTVARLRADLPEVMQEIASGVAADARARIGHYQLGWAPLAASTVREKTRHGYSPPDNPLLRTGAMRRSIRGEGAALIAEVRADAPARWQEQGTTRKVVGQAGYRPPRPFMRPALVESVPMARRLLAEAFETAIKES
ncbi:MAG: hypothetical protein ACREFP_03130 [Acetobacteraceae bacterium]